MTLFLQYGIRKAFQNIRGNLFPNLTTIAIIAISILIFSAFTLISSNLSSFLKIWEDKIEVIAYLKKGVPLDEVERLLKNTRQFEGIEGVNYISPFDAMAFMESKLGSQKNLLQGIQPAVLPSSFEIKLKKDYRNYAKIKEVVSWLKQFSQFEEIQYGQEWVETFSALVHIVHTTQWILGSLFIIAIIFIISNVLQLTIASRKEEIELMQLVGASPTFIRIPFYIEGLVQGFLGAGLAIFFLYLLYKGFLLYLPPTIEVWLKKVPILFLPLWTIVGIVIGGMFLGFFGSMVASTRLLNE